MTRCPVCSGENADTQRFCGECGTPLPASSRRSAPAPAPEADETILLPTAELPLGSIFAHRYQVVEELGAGGMGRVYRVLDKKISEEIALKLIRPDVASDRKILERFAAELKLISTVHAAGGRVFLAHPLTISADAEELDRIVAGLKTEGLDGIEALYSPYPAAVREVLTHLARKHHLLISAGTDFHGPTTPGLSLPATEMPTALWKTFRKAVAAPVRTPRDR